MIEFRCNGTFSYYGNSMKGWAIQLRLTFRPGFWKHCCTMLHFCFWAQRRHQLLQIEKQACSARFCKKQTKPCLHYFKEFPRLPMIRTATASLQGMFMRDFLDRTSYWPDLKVCILRRQVEMAQLGKTVWNICG